MLLYNRNQCNYRFDGYIWKKRKDGRLTREDHQRLKVKGTECIGAYYAHSAVWPTFHRRAYYSLSNPDVVLVHYLNVSTTDANLPSKVAHSLSTLLSDHPRQKLVNQVKCIFGCTDDDQAEKINNAVNNFMDNTASAKNPTIEPRVFNDLMTIATVSREREASGSRKAPHHPLPQKTPEVLRIDFVPIPRTPAVSPKKTEETPPGVSHVPPPHEHSLPRESVLSTPGPMQVLPPQHNFSPHAPQSQFSPSHSRISVNGHTQQAPLDHSETVQIPQSGHPNLGLTCEDVHQTLNANFVVGGFDPSVRSTDEFHASLIPTEDDLYNCLAGRGDFDAGTVVVSNGSLLGEQCSSNGHLQRAHDPMYSQSYPHRLQTSVSKQPEEPAVFDRSNAVATITDFSPEWSYPEGHVKLLISGPWFSNQLQYFCVFDHVLRVGASLVQPGVLKCYCPPHAPDVVLLEVGSGSTGIMSNAVKFEYRTKPAHAPGVVLLEVGSGSTGIISNAVKFEYRTKPGHAPPKIDLHVARPSDWIGASDSHLAVGLLERFEYIESCLSSAEARKGLPLDSVGYRYPSINHDSVTSIPTEELERRFLSVVSKMTNFDWVQRPVGSVIPHHFSLTLMHFAAALGMTRLIRALHSWSVEKPSPVLSRDVNTLLRDDNGFVALTYACSRNHVDTAAELVALNRDSLFCPNLDGELPLVVAFRAGHVDLVRRLVIADLESSGAANLDTVLWVGALWCYIHTVSRH